MNNEQIGKIVFDTTLKTRHKNLTSYPYPTLCTWSAPSLSLDSRNSTRTKKMIMVELWRSEHTSKAVKTSTYPTWIILTLLSLPINRQKPEQASLWKSSCSWGTSFSGDIGYKLTTQNLSSATDIHFAIIPSILLEWAKPTAFCTCSAYCFWISAFRCITHFRKKNHLIQRMKTIEWFSVYSELTWWWID